MKQTAPYRKVMAIVNATPDSFYAPSRAEGEEAVARRVAEVVAQGADIVDIGGYSTRPDAVEVAAEEELRRVLSAVEQARRVAPEVQISIDTFRSEVAEAVLSRWDNIIINDITAGEADERMVDVVAHWGAPMVAMHTKGSTIGGVRSMHAPTNYTDVVAEVRDYLACRAEWLTSKGVREVIIDPGFGFAKNVEQNFELMRGIENIAALGYPMLVGISRKSFIYKSLGTQPDDNATLAATTALHWESLCGGAAVLRVHDVAEARATVNVFEKTYNL